MDRRRTFHQLGKYQASWLLKCWDAGSLAAADGVDSILRMFRSSRSIGIECRVLLGVWMLMLSPLGLVIEDISGYGVLCAGYERNR